MVPEPPPSEDAMPLPTDLDPEADQAVQALLHSQPGLTIPRPVRSRILSALSDEAATRAALFGNDVDLVAPSEPFTKTAKHQPSPARHGSSPESPPSP